MTRLLGIALALLSACASAPGQPVDDAPSIVATVYPLAWLADEVAPRASVTLLGGGGQDPHDVELSPDERRALETADVVLHVGDIGFQPQLEQVLQDRRGAKVALADVAGARVRRAPDAAGEPAVDPHLWLDPLALHATAVPLADALATIDAAGADGYARRADEVGQRLGDLHAELDEILSACDQTTAVVSHEAFGYLLATRDIEQVGIAGTSGHVSASPQRLAEMVELVRDQDLPAVLAEATEGRTDAEALAREAGVEVLDVSSLEIVEPQEAEQGYPELLRAQAATFAAALRCRGTAEDGGSR